MTQHVVMIPSVMTAQRMTLRDEVQKIALIV
jgi:hypothetical protein